MCDVDEEAVVTAADAPSIYDIPKVLHREGLDAYVVRRLDLPFRDVDWTVWDDLLRRVHHPKEEVTVALVGKYIDLPDAYLSVTEALRAGGFAHEAKVNIRWIASDECETPAGAAAHLGDVDAICVPGGFGIRGIEGKLGALHLRPHPRHPDARPVPGPAVHGDRVRPQRRRPREGRARPSSTRTPRAGHRHDGGAEDASSRAPATWAAPCGWASTRPSSAEGSVVRAAYGEAPDRGAAPAPLRGQQRLPRPARGGRAWSSPARRPDLDLVEFVELPARRAPLLRRHPGAPRAALAPDPAAPAVRGPGRCRDRAAEGAAVPDRRVRAASATDED